MRTAAFLTLVTIVFSAACYLTLEYYKLTKPLAFGLVLATTIGFLVLYILIQYKPFEGYADYKDDPAMRTYAYQQQERQRITKEQKQQLLAAIKANPALQSFRPQVESGHIQSMEDLAYRADPASRVTCSHLRPFEDQARKTGCVVWLIHAWNLTPVPGVIYADAVLAPLPPLPEHMVYKEEDYWDERSGPYFAASLACTQCNSIIQCRHPREQPRA